MKSQTICQWCRQQTQHCTLLQWSQVAGFCVISPQSKVCVVPHTTGVSTNLPNPTSSHKRPTTPEVTYHCKAAPSYRWSVFTMSATDPSSHVPLSHLRCQRRPTTHIRAGCPALSGLGRGAVLAQHQGPVSSSSMRASKPSPPQMASPEQPNAARPPQAPPVRVPGRDGVRCVGAATSLFRLQLRCGTPSARRPRRRPRRCRRPRQRCPQAAALLRTPPAPAGPHSAALGGFDRGL